MMSTGLISYACFNPKSLKTEYFWSALFEFLKAPNAPHVELYGPDTHIGGCLYFKTLYSLDDHTPVGIKPILERAAAWAGLTHPSGIRETLCHLRRQNELVFGLVNEDAKARNQKLDELGKMEFSIPPGILPIRMERCDFAELERRLGQENEEQRQEILDQLPDVFLPEDLQDEGRSFE